MDILTLGGVTFTDFAVPDRMPFGGDHAMVIHRLPGGRIVIDMLGPDDHNISWHGRLWGNDAMGQAMALDAMRRSGQPLPLSFAGMSYMVVIQTFEAEIERYPHDVLYEIVCVTLTTSGMGAVGAAAGALGGIALATADLAAAAAI